MMASDSVIASLARLLPPSRPAEAIMFQSMRWAFLTVLHLASCTAEAPDSGSFRLLLHVQDTVPAYPEGLELEVDGERLAWTSAISPEFRSWTIDHLLPGDPRDRAPVDVRGVYEGQVVIA